MKLKMGITLIIFLDYQRLEEHLTVDVRVKVQ